MRTLDAIVLRLENLGLGSGGTTIFAGSDVAVPNGPGPFISILETAGRPPLGAHNTSSLRQPGFQIVGRGDIYPDVGTLVDQAYAALGGVDGLANILLGDVFFLTIRPAGEPFNLPNDAQGRVRIAFNVNTIRR